MVGLDWDCRFPLLNLLRPALRKYCAISGWYGMNSLVLPKMSFFAKEALWGKVLILDLLQRRGYSLVNLDSLDHEESIDDTHLHHGKARVLRGLLFSLSLEFVGDRTLY